MIPLRVLLAGVHALVRAGGNIIMQPFQFMRLG